MFRLVIQISKGLIREPRARRMMMFYGMAAALVLLFLGATFFDAWLRVHPILFLVYWGACAWVTVLAVLLAVFDMLLIRAAARRDEREMAKAILKKDGSE